MGYERSAQVETSGQFSVRGGIIDVFPLTEENPRELNFGEMKSIRSAVLMRRVRDPLKISKRSAFTRLPRWY